MRRIIKAILPILSRNPNQQSENKKISYWLEKLFTQEKEKVENEKRPIAEGENPEFHPSTNLQVPLSDQDIKQSTEEIGFEDAKKSRAKKKELDKHILEDMVKNSNQILISIHSLFPWDFFPSTLNVEATRVTIIHRQFFASQVYSVDIKDISNVFIDTGFQFATITIVSRTFSQNEVKIIRLQKKKAVFARRIIEGLRMFAKENIDTTNYSTEELISKLKELSTTKIVM